MGLFQHSIKIYVGIFYRIGFRSQSYVNISVWNFTLPWNQPIRVAKNGHVILLIGQFQHRVEFHSKILFAGLGPRYSNTSHLSDSINETSGECRRAESSKLQNSSDCNYEELTHFADIGNKLDIFPRFFLSLAFLLSPVAFYILEWMDNQIFGYGYLKKCVRAKFVTISSGTI